MERFDAAVVGAGPEGLIAAILLARAGRRVIVVEKESQAGGRASTREFHPGFRASTYADELPEIPSRLLRSLDLARHGALLIPAPASICVSESGTTALYADEERATLAVPSDARSGFVQLRYELERCRKAIDARSLSVAPRARRRWFNFWRRRKRPQPWPGDDYGRETLDDVLRGRISDPALRLHLMAEVASGRAVSPHLTGTALHLLAPGTGRSGMVAGGLGALAAALARIATEAGAVIRYGTEVKSLRIHRGRAMALVLPGDEELEAGAIISSLDIKRTISVLVGMDNIPSANAARVGQFRISAQSARVLVALDAAPEFSFSLDDPDFRFGPIHIVASEEAMTRAHDSWAAGMLPETPPVTLRVPSLSDPSLAPIGKATMTMTVSSIPYRLVDGPWSAAKREVLVKRALAAALRVFPSISEHVLATRTVVPTDVEAALGVTEGDLDGGEFAPDQSFGFRPFGEGEAGWSFGWANGRTPIGGLYLGSQSAAPAPCFLGVAGERAARALMSDFPRERSK